MSLGFIRVVHEMAETINQATKKHVNELNHLNSNISDNHNTDNYVKTSLEKLAFTMSDRASRERKADRLLDEWHDEELKNCDEEQHHEIPTTIAWLMCCWVSTDTYVWTWKSMKHSWEWSMVTLGVMDCPY